jgi:putative copper export protein
MHGKLGVHRGELACIVGQRTEGAAVIQTVLLLVHVGIAATWLGGMVYSLAVVQPKAARFFGTDEEAHEAFLTTMASGNRSKVLALIGALALTGGALLLVVADPAEPLQLGIHAAKGALLLAALAVFADVSWRQWPRRLFALPDERAAVRARFQRSAYALVAIVGLAFVLGVIASQLGHGPVR